MKNEREDGYETDNDGTDYYAGDGYNLDFLQFRHLYLQLQLDEIAVDETLD